MTLLYIFMLYFCLYSTQRECLTCKHHEELQKLQHEHERRGWLLILLSKQNSPPLPV